MADKKATLTIGEETYDFAMRDAAVGPSVIDISTLYKNTDCFTFDPGFTSTASCESALTYIDGDQGILLHRGYPIDQLAEEGDFLETCYLLLYRRAADQRPVGRGFDLRRSCDQPHDAARSNDEAVFRLPSRCASNGDHGWCCWRSCRPSITTPPT